jgi:hypothetical protein
MDKPSFTVVCRRLRGRWEISIPDVPDLALVIERLEDVPEAARKAIATGQRLNADEVHVLLDVRGA